MGLQYVVSSKKFVTDSPLMWITDNVAYTVCREVVVSEQLGELVNYVSLAGLLSNQLEHKEFLLWVLRLPYQQAK